MSKRLLLRLTSVILFILTASVMKSNAMASNVVDTGSCGNSLTYTMYDDGLVLIEGTGDMTNYTTSSYTPWRQYTGYVVQKVEIGEGVTTIGNNAFASCTKLQRVSMANTVTKLGEAAFSGCVKLIEINISTSVTEIPKEAFANCKLLPEITLPDGVTRIGQAAFNTCEKLSFIEFPAGLKTIEAKAFAECKILNGITLPDGIAYIGNDAFQMCRNLASITIPDSVTELGTGAFGNCPELTKLVMPCRFEKVKLSYPSTCTVYLTHHMEHVEAKESTKKETGLKEHYTCSQCERLYWDENGKEEAPLDMVVIAKIRCTHNYEATVTVEPTYTKEGETTYTCPECDDVKTESINKLILVKPDISLSIANGGINISWKSVEGATGYELYKKSSDDNMALYKTFDSKTLSYKDTKANKVGVASTYVLYAVVIEDEETVKSEASLEKTGCYVPNPTVKSAYTADTGVSVLWERNKNITGYSILRSEGNGKYKKIDTVSGSQLDGMSTTSKNSEGKKVTVLTYNDKKAKKNGVLYSYKITAICTIGETSYESPASDVVSAYCITRPKITYCKNTSKKTVTVKWGKLDKATGYEITYSTSSSFKSAKKITVSKNTSISKTLTKLTKGKTYYIKVRSYITIDGKKRYSTWSDSKKIKITK